MENFARKQNLDPTLPSTWNRIPFKSIYESKVLSCYFLLSLHILLIQIKGREDDHEEVQRSVHSFDFNFSKHWASQFWQVQERYKK